MPPLNAYRDEEEMPPPGPARAAILLLALGAPGAARLLKHLTPEEIRLVRNSAAELADVSQEQIELLVGDFQEAFKAGPSLSGPGRQMTELLQSALSEEELAAVLGEEGDDSGVLSLEMDLSNIWEEVEKLDGNVLAPMLAREHPQVVAVLLAKVSADTASAIVGALETSFRNDVMRRMLALQPLARPVQILFETHVRQAYLPASDAPEKTGSHAVLADIVNRMDKSQSESLIEEISRSQPKDAEALRSLLFVFEDIPALSQKARLVLFDAVQADLVTVALRGASSEVQECVLSALGARTRRMVEAELKQDAAIPPAEIAGARRQIATTALRLSAEGKLQIRSEEAE